MKRILPIIIVVVTALLLAVGLTGAGRSSGTIGIAAGSALPGFSAKADTPEQAMANFLIDVQRRNWDRAFSDVAKTDNRITLQSFQQEWLGSNGGLRAFSNLESYDARPLHATDSEAQMRAQLHWITPVG